MNYSRLSKRNRECFDLYEVTKNTKYLVECDCIDHFFECEGYAKYEFVAKFCTDNNISKIYDIGCAYGHQSEVFLNTNIEYVGIDSGINDFWNKDKYKYTVNEYPFKINTSSNDLAVSVLCLTWNCYLYEGDVTLHNQLKQLSEDFNHCLLYIANDKVDIVSEYFDGYKKVGDFYYFYKK